LGEAGALALTKGESKRVSHSIEWNQYKLDDLAVKVTVLDSMSNPAPDAVLVSPTLNLNFEKHQFRFDYEVKAGTMDGTYKIRLTPAAGKPVEVQVVVK